MSSNPAIATPAVPVPWWKFGHVWLVVAGPAAVVVAAVITAIIAINGADPVIDPDYYRNGITINERADGVREVPKSMAPAGTGRNHAATPAHDHPTDR